MKQVENPRFTSFKEKLLPLPFVLLMTLAVVFLLGGLLFFMYSIILVAALKSAMVFLLVFAASMICVGFGLLSLNGFFAYGKYYKKRMDKSYVPPQKEEKTLKDYITPQNVALVVLLVGAICAISSAALGCMNRDKWVQTLSTYMEQNDYYADVKYREVRFQTTDDINAIVVELDVKNAVIIYTEDADKQGFITVDGYEKYKNQLSLTVKNRTLTVTEGERPSLDGAKEKLLFFMFDENEIENQIRIYIPKELENSIDIEGEYILAKPSNED
ncbi:MAG: hypothetical protein IK048_00680 [Clostridia bacterium]|nr:hypothetical protein [Clostridia bacterium]